MNSVTQGSPPPRRGCSFLGRPALEELRQDLRAVPKKCRPDGDITTPEVRATRQDGRKELFYPYGKTYAQTLLSAIKIVAAGMKIRLPADVAIDVEVGLWTTGRGHFLQARFKQSQENYVGYERTENFASSGATLRKLHVYSLPARLALNH
jgi:hypothetical protein